MRFAARVKTDTGDWIEFAAIRWIDLDSNGRSVRICGPNGLQYTEFELIAIDEESDNMAKYDWANLEPKIDELLAEGKTQVEIAKAIGVDARALWWHLKQTGRLESKQKAPAERTDGQGNDFEHRLRELRPECLECDINKLLR